MTEVPLPAVQVTVSLESVAASIEFLGIDSPTTAEKLGAWLGVDSERRAWLMSTLLLLRRRPGDLPAGDEVLAAIEQTLGPLEAAAAGAPKNRLPLAAALAVRAPMGSLQGWTLGRIVDAGESSRAWLRWALARDWPQDPDFADALHIVCEHEGLTPYDPRADEAGTP